MKQRKERRDIPYANSCDALFEALPELRPACDALTVYYAPQKPPEDIVFANLFCNFIRRLLASDKANPGSGNSTALLRRCFEFIEDLACSAEFSTRCLAEVSVLESLVGEDESDWRHFSPHFRQETRRMARELIIRWRHPDPLKSNPPRSV